jgi:hypothetical protein
MKHWVIPVIGVILIAGGAFGLARGEFSYTKDEHQADLGGIELALKEKERIEIPKWLAGGAIVAGALLLLMGRKPG